LHLSDRQRAGAVAFWGAFVVSDITQILKQVGRGETAASERLLPLVYEELRRLAAARMAQEAAGHTLQPTALVHEAWLRLVMESDRSWENRAHFFRTAALAMRRILVDRARTKASLKRGGGRERVNIDDIELAASSPDDRVLLVDGALDRLEAEDPESARIVVLKFFGGLTNKEVAESLGVTERTVERQWAYAKASLFQMIRHEL
jgi:RNA polymerase sigma factor (TIGR02999 family)